MAYEADLEGFAARYAEANAELAYQIAVGRAFVEEVVLQDNKLWRVVALFPAFDVDGMRSRSSGGTDIHPRPWRSGHTVEEQDIRVAVELALPYRHC